MKSPRTSTILAGVLSLLFAIPALGQITTSIEFETTFPFYAGGAKMPAGAYRVTQPDSSESMLLVENSSGSHSAFVEFNSTSSENPHAQSDVTFNKYGKTDFLNLLWVQGQNSGMQIVPTKAEQMAAKAAAPVRHSVSAKNGG